MSTADSISVKPRAMTCKWCDRSFNKGEHLRRHERAHTGTKPFVCRECKRSFNRQDSLARHEKLHARTGVSKLTDHRSLGSTPKTSSRYPSPSPTEGLSSTPTSLAGTEPYDVSISAISGIEPGQTQLEDHHTTLNDLPHFPLPGEQDFSLIWPDTEDLFQSIISFDNQWQIPVGTLPFSSDCQQTIKEDFSPLPSFADRASSIGTIPSGGNHQAVHNVSKIVANLSSSVTAAAEATSINSVFLDECLHMFFVKFIPTFPILHRATFIFRECTHPLLLNAIAIGSLYLGPKDAITKGETLWRLAHTAVSTSWQSLITHRGAYDACEGVQLVITALLAQLYGALSKNRAIRTASQAFRSLGLFWARQSGMFDCQPTDVTTLPSTESSEAEKQHHWRLWVGREIQKRALLGHYMLDGLIAEMSGEPTTVRHAANSLCTPSSEAVFDASNAVDWLLLMQVEKTDKLAFRNIFRMLFTRADNGQLHSHPFTAFTHKVLLEGLQSLSSDCREGHEAIGAPAKVEVQSALIRTYESINQSSHLQCADQLEALLRWHSICLDLEVPSSNLCVTLCASLDVQQNIWKAGKAQTAFNLSQWTTTSDARRVLAHAVAIQEIVEQLPRGRAHAIHMPSSLFAAAIVYAVFTLAGGIPSVRLPASVYWPDVLSTDIMSGRVSTPSHSPTASDTQRYIKGEPLLGRSVISRNLLYELNSMSKLFRCLCSQWGIAYDMAQVVDQLIMLCH